jgi:hypothetical protein
MDPACTFANEPRAIAFSTQLPQRLNLLLRCGDKLVFRSSFPLHADEQVNLRRDAQPSLNRNRISEVWFGQTGSAMYRAILWL